MPSLKIRVALADDHTLFRQGVRQLLTMEEDVALVAEATNGREALELARTARPDVFLVDIDMPDLDGLAATQALVREFPAMRVIIVMTHADEGYILQALATGAAGYVLKDMGAEHLVAAIRQVVNDEVALDRHITAKVVSEFRRLAQQAQAEYGLLPHEIDLLRLLASGYSNKEIAISLNLAESTVKNKLSVIFQKVGVQDRTQAAIYALSRGLLSVGDSSASPAA